MLNNAIKTITTFGLGIVIVSSSLAAEEREFSWSASLAGTSDYIFRGISFNNEDPAFQPSINMNYGILYWGVWGSNIAAPFGPWETDFYAGITPALGPVTFDLGALYYTYSADDTAYLELKAGASMSPVSDLKIGTTVWYTPDQDNYVETFTIEGTATYTLPSIGMFSPAVIGLIGYTEAPNGDDFTGLGVDDYTYWSAALALTVEKFTFDLRYWDTDISSALDAGLADERFVFTMSILLP